jgi:lactate dehydrogenase-like 2-hydroxyacid dehydrogenase
MTIRIAILDDYQRVALGMADWSAVAARAEIAVFDRPIGAHEAVATLAPYDIVCHLRERMAFPRTLIEALPNLKLLCVTGPGHRKLDLAAATARFIPVCNTKGDPRAAYATPELTISLMLALVRHIAAEHGACARDCGRAWWAPCCTAGHSGFWALAMSARASRPWPAPSVWSFSPGAPTSPPRAPPRRAPRSQRRTNSSA